MTAWTAVWVPGPGRMRWELLVTDEAGNIAMRERSAALACTPHPGDGLLVTMGLCPAGQWERGEGGSWSCPVIVTSAAREAALAAGLAPRPGGTGVH